MKKTILMMSFVMLCLVGVGNVTWADDAACQECLTSEKCTTYSYYNDYYKCSGKTGDALKKCALDACANPAGLSDPCWDVCGGA